MQPLKITILGDFWDCQIYRGRLYIWTMDGSLLTYRWDEFVNSLSVEPELRLALECGFCRGDYLYNQNFELLFSDIEMVRMLKSKFEKLSEQTFEFQINDLTKFLYGVQDDPLKEHSADSDIFDNHLYSAVDTGLWKASVHRGNLRYPVSSRPEKLWDGRLLSLKSSTNGRLALSAGDQGLYEFDVNEKDSFENLYRSKNFKKIERNLHQLNDKHSFFANWNYSSIYSTSNVNESYMMLFGWGDDDFKESEMTFNKVFKEKKLIFNKLLNETDLFVFSKEAGASQLSWGCGNKIYKASEGGIDVIDYTQKFALDKENAAFTDVQHIPFQPWKGSVISGGVSYFGVIIECENALVVIKDDNEFFNIPDSVTRWRVYPRSKRYENHLHVISEDKIDIYSFNHDYFRQQDGKKIGMKYFDKSIFSGYRYR